MSDEVKEIHIDYWDTKDSEILNYTDIGEAVEGLLDGIEPAEWPETLTLIGYVRIVPSLDASHVLEDILERLDETYGNPDGDYSEATDKMTEAAEAFCKAVLSEYASWACEPVVERIINVKEWTEET